LQITAAVGGDLQDRRLRVTRVAELLPPAADRRDRELGGLLGDPDVDEAVVGADVIDAVGDRLAQRLVGEVVNVDSDRIALGAPLTAAVLVLADELLLLGVDADRRPVSLTAAVTLSLMCLNCASRSGC
jgi:hypothetical protein